MATENQYYDRVKQIDDAWQAMKTVEHGWSYITDECVDWENASHCEKNSPEFWDAMLMSLECSTAMRLEEMGIKWSSFPIALNY